MAKSMNKEERHKLLCEKVLNESWSSVGKYSEDIQLALEKRNPSKYDLALIKLAARAFVQRDLMEKADSAALFGVDLYDLSACGQNLKEDCPCGRDICLVN
jgi:hypothetical protein